MKINGDYHPGSNREIKQGRVTDYVLEKILPLFPKPQKVLVQLHRLNYSEPIIDEDLDIILKEPFGSTGLIFQLDKPSNEKILAIAKDNEKNFMISYNSVHMSEEERSKLKRLQLHEVIWWLGGGGNHSEIKLIDDKFYMQYINEEPETFKKLRTELESLNIAYISSYNGTNASVHPMLDNGPKIIINED